MRLREAGNAGLSVALVERVAPRVGRRRVAATVGALAPAQPADWLESLGRPETESELQAVRTAVRRGCPFGGQRWRKNTAVRLGLEFTLRPRGRPRNDG